jgi:hypothetical protein
MVTIPAILSLLPLRPQPIRAAGESRRFGLSLDRMLTRPTIYSDRRPERIVVAFAVLLAISLAGITRLTTDSSQVGQFPPHHHLRVADDIENRYFAGSNVLDILIDGIGVDAMKNPEMLARIDELQRRIEKAPTVRDSFSIVELIKRMNRVMNEDRPDAEVVPSTRDLVAQYLLLYSISGDPGDFDDLIDYDYRYAHVLVFVPTPGTAVSHAVVKRARKIAADLFPPDGPVQASVKFSGRAYSNAALERYINSSQLRSLAICLPVLFLIAWLVFGRAVLGLLCIGPVSLAVLIIYGGMGFISLPTDIATTMIGAMTLGIGIDFAIHYLHRYNSCLAAGMEPSVAAVETSRTAGRALFYNAIILIGGFIVLLGARFYPEIKLGALISATMVICYFSTMLLFPAVLGKLHRSKPTTAHDSDSKPFLPAEGSPKISRVA